MRIRNIIPAACLLAGLAVLPACTVLTGMGYGNIAGVAMSGMVKGQFRVQLVECVGNAGAQSVVAVMTVTNTGPNTHLFIGGSSDGSFAVDGYGATSKPYGSAGHQYELPSGVAVRVEIPRIEPVRPGMAMFQTLRVSIGSGKGSTIDFRNVPIVWTN